MKVDSVHAHLLGFPSPDSGRGAMLIQVNSSNGLTGHAPGPASERARDSVVNVIGPFLEGRALADPDALRVQFGEHHKPAANDPELMRAYGAVEVALWDLTAQHYGVPLSEVIGGRTRDRIALYASGGLCVTPEEYAEQAAAIGALGFRAYSMPLAGGPAADLKAIRRMREAAAINLMIDAHAWWSYPFETVEQVAKQMAEFDPLWLEEPLPPGDLASYMALKERELIPLAGGFHESGEEALFDLLQSAAIDYLQMDIATQGGFAMARRLMGTVARLGLRFIPRTGPSDLGVLVAAHLGICREETVVEWLEYPFPSALQLLKDPLQIERGELIVPRGAGLGIEIDPAIIEKYPWGIA